MADMSTSDRSAHWLNTGLIIGCELQVQLGGEAPRSESSDCTALQTEWPERCRGIETIRK